MLYIKDLCFGDLFCAQNQVFQAITDPRKHTIMIHGSRVNSHRIEAMIPSPYSDSECNDIVYKFSQTEGLEHNSTFLYSYEAYLKSKTKHNN